MVIGTLAPIVVWFYGSYVVIGAVAPKGAMSCLANDLEAWVEALKGWLEAPEAWPKVSDSWLEALESWLDALEAWLDSPVA